MTARRTGERGFSMLELLAAMTIFAIIAVIAQQGTFSTLTASHRIDARSSELAELQLAVSLVTRDLHTIQPRQMRTGPRARMPALTLKDAGTEVSFSRSAPPDPTGRARGAFRRVSYAAIAASDGRPMRTEWTAIDRPSDAAPDRAALLDPLITSLRFAVYADGTWQNEWPPAEGGAPLPDALSVTFDTVRWGEITRVVALR